MNSHPELIETLRTAQRLGFFGDGSVDDAVAHALYYLAPLETLAHGATVIDLGSGGGLPGLVIANARPDLRVVLVDRREKRTDFLRLAVRRLALDHVEVWCDDVDNVRSAVTAGSMVPFDAVTARGFGPPDYFLSCVVDLLSPTGVAVISEPPAASGDRWSGFDVAGHGLAYRRAGSVAMFRQV